MRLEQLSRADRARVRRGYVPRAYKRVGMPMPPPGMCRVERMCGPGWQVQPARTVLVVGSTPGDAGTFIRDTARRRRIPDEIWPMGEVLRAWFSGERAGFTGVSFDLVIVTAAGDALGAAEWASTRSTTACWIEPRWIGGCDLRPRWIADGDARSQG